MPKRWFFLRSSDQFDRDLLAFRLSLQFIEFSALKPRIFPKCASVILARL